MYNKHLTKYFEEKHISNKKYLSLNMLKDYINRGLDIHYNNDAIIYSLVSIHHNVELLKYLFEKYTYNQEVKDNLINLSFLRYYDITKYLFSIGSTSKYIRVSEIELLIRWKKFESIDLLIENNFDMKIISPIYLQQYNLYSRNKKLKKIYE